MDVHGTGFKGGWSAPNLGQYILSGKRFPYVLKQVNEQAVLHLCKMYRHPLYQNCMCRRFYPNSTIGDFI